MKKIKPSTENEMVYEFLKMEIESSRYKEKIETTLDEMQLSRNIITNGDITSETENVIRAKILGQFRGYRDTDMFDEFPKNIEWFWTEFDSGDISKIKYIIYSYWNELSDYTGSPLEAANTILSGKLIYDLPNDDFIKGAELIKSGHRFPPLIFLTDKTEQRYVILEGHSRMTSYGLVPELFQNVSVLLGYCEADELNKWHGEMPTRKGDK
jgi:hypothetical protein